MHRRSGVALVGLTSVTLVLAACSSSKSSNPTSGAAATSAAAGATSAASAVSSDTASASAGAAGALFGTGCASLGVPPAALAAAATLPVGIAAAAVPTLKNVVTAATVGGLVPTLNAAPALTVFAPNDAAFSKEPPATLQGLLTKPALKPQLVNILKYHVLGTEVAKDALVGTHPTLQGKSLTITGSGDDFTIDGKAKIVCGPIKTKNATVYVIDSVLHGAG